MAQDVSKKMAEEPWILNEDGYLNADTDIKEIVYHPTLNVILLCTKSGVVKVLDVNTGVVLQSSNLSAINQNEVTCRYIPGQDRILFTDGQAIGVRSEYNGVLLLDSILQKIISDPNEEVRVELPLSEAIILKQSLLSSGVTGVDNLLKELTNLIANAQKCDKKGIKAQKWNIVCLKLPLNELRSATMSTVTNILAKNLHIPELAVASAIQERMSELLGEIANASDRRAMASESKRRDTFSQWPHMDYKWALPEQMAQAGFYHQPNQPNAPGEDRALCFTCAVCLVCWEKTDEPWSEHERHSQNCPFMMGEYTHNVPISVIFASSPAVDATYRGMNIKVLGTSSVPNLIPASNDDGLVSIFDISGKITRPHSFYVSQYDSHVLDKITLEFSILTSGDGSNSYPMEKSVTALSIIDQKISSNAGSNLSTSPTIRPTVICGLKIKSKASKITNSTFVIHDLDENNHSMQSPNDMELSYPQISEKSCLFLVIYDFLFKKKEETVDDDLETFMENDKEEDSLQGKEKNLEFIAMSGINTLDEINLSPKYLMKHFQTFYKAFIPDESDEICPPPTEVDPKKWFDKKWPESRVLSSNSSEADSCLPVTCLNQDNLLNGQISSLKEISQEKSISDHINDLKSKRLSKKLNYSRAVQCIILPSQYKNRNDLIISDILTTLDGFHILVVLKSTNNAGGVLLSYSLDFSSKKVTVNPVPVHSRELTSSENPVQVILLPAIEKFGNSVGSKGIEGELVMVCSDGAVRIVELRTMKTICYAKLEGEKFTSAAYCNSLERLCVSTEEGSLHFYVLNDTDNESLEDHEDEDMFCSSESTIYSSPYSELPDGSEMRCFHEPTATINLTELKNLYSLTQFEPLKAGYCAVVPPCWTEIQQAQRQRRHPQSLSVDGEAYTKTWRLQTDLTTWDEHIFEISLPCPMVLGHVDIHFTLQPSTTLPHVEVTLLKQNSAGIGHKRDVNFSVDESITIGMLQWADNPVISQEYLRSHNADILAGPVNIASSLDLTEQSGMATLTSPKLFKSRNRTLLLHLSVVYSKEEECNRQNKSGKKTDWSEESGFTPRKSETYMGCDCIHELSITVYASKHTELPFQIASERQQRSLMLESNVFVLSLIHTLINNRTYSVQNFVLDILNWIASIRLTRNRSNNGEAPLQQIEFISIIENQSHGIIHRSFLSGGRSLAHRCAKLITTCSRGAKNINDDLGESFDFVVMNNLLTLLDSIGEIKSAGSLQWFFNILLAVTPRNEVSIVATNCRDLLVKISDELVKKTNPYHLLLRTRYGLYGTPMEPEMFDIEPPPYPKGSSVSITYASVVGGEQQITSSDFYSIYSFYKEIINPKEVMSTSDNIMKCKNISSAKLFKGLIETEPLHFVCVSASEGTRLDKADEANSVMSNIVVNNVPVVYPDTSTITGTSKKDDIQLFWNNVIDMMNNMKNFTGGSTSLSEKFLSHLKNPPYTLIVDELGLNGTTPQMFSDGLRSNKVANKLTTSKNFWQMEDILSPEFQMNNIWQHLLVGSPQQVIVVERMHSGARRFVILDFGQPVILTDLLIPACNDLVSVSIDVWLRSEDVDPIRIAVSSDIGSRNLVLNDLLPPPICRFIKITVVGRYGMSTTRCRIPIGFFYGHMVLKSDELSNEVNSSVKTSTPNDIEKHLANLSKIFEDVSCRYSISCSKLKDTLQGFIVADVKNASHLLSYMNTMKEKSSSLYSLEHNKVFQAYREAITYQRQLNTIRNIMSRLEEKPNDSERQNDLSNVCTEKLVAIAEGLLEVLLSIDYVNDIDIETCQKLFKGFCVSQSPRLQFLAATYLKNTSTKCDFWGNFLADILAEMFSSSYSQTFPQDRVFVLIAYLSKLSPHRSSVLDAALRVTHECLSNLEENRKPLLAISVDLPLLSWLLMYLSLQLDMNKNSSKSIARWDWVFGEMLGKATMENTKTRLHKKALKKQIGTIDSSSNKIPLMHKVSIPIPNMPNSKNGQEFFMKMLNYTIPDNEITVKKVKEKKTPQVHEEKSTPKKNPLYIDEAHVRVVATGLINLILSMDHSSSADMLLLSFKIIARLTHLSKSSYFSKIRLVHLMNDAQLLNLVNFCLQSKIPWATHALACLLEDFLDPTLHRSSNEVEGETASVASTSWDPSNEAESNNEHIFDDNLITATCIINNKNKQLPSVYESDSSELEELVEEVFGKEQNQPKKRPGKTVISSSSCLSSCAIDSRLDLGVETLSEIYLRKLLLQNNQVLVQNISSNSHGQEREKKLLPWKKPLQQYSAIKMPATNHKMLMDCFHSLFQDLDRRSPETIERILQLWLTLNSTFKGDKFDRSQIPVITLKPESVHTLISVLTYTSGLSLITWCIALQTLTLVCNTIQVRSEIHLNQVPARNMCMARMIIEHAEFGQFLLRLMSEDWLIYSERGMAGPSVCQAINDLLVQIQISFDVMPNYAEVSISFKNLLLNLINRMIQQSGPIACRQGPLDAQCKLIQSMLAMNFENADLDVALSILENTGGLVHAYVTNTERVRCFYSGELSNASFRQLYSTVLGTDAIKQERPVSYDFLLILLLKLSGKLVKTRIVQRGDVEEPMETTSSTSQTDESKAEQIQLNMVNAIPCLADKALQHHDCIIKLCTALSVCKSSSICMLACISQKSSIVSNFSEPNTLADGVFYVLISLAKCALEKELIMQPLLMFLSQNPQLSEPLIWFILQILDTEETIKSFFEAGGLSILSFGFVTNISAPNTISKTGTISTVMQFFNKNKSVECNVPVGSSKKSALDEQLENRLSLVNFAPCSSIKCSSTTAQPADILIQGNTTTHRRARTPQWSYHFYPEEVYTELVLTLPSAILLKQVHLQPHSIALSTCPSAVGLEISASGTSRLVPVGPPMTTSGMPYIQLDLPSPEVVKCILIRLYKPKMANNISLSQIRLLGFPAFNEKLSSFIVDNEQHCKQSLGWIRLLHHCFSVPSNKTLIKNMVACCANVPDLLSSTCGLLLVPSHVLPDYLPCLEKVVRELSLHNLECSMITLKILLESKCSSTDLLNSSDNLWQDHLLVNNNGYQSTCELLYQICEYQDSNTPSRISIILEWVQTVARNAFATGVINECNPAYFSYVASILWHANSDSAAINYDLKSMITRELFDCVVHLESFFEHNLSLKYSLDSLLCSICYIQPEFYPILLRHFGILIPNLSNDYGSSVPDDRKGTTSMTDDNKKSFVEESGWYDHLVVGNLAQLKISNGQLETVALVSRSPTSVQQLLDSGLPKILICAILEFCSSSEENEIPMAKLEKISAILKFFTEVSEEKPVRDWLGSEEGSSFWLHLLQWLCKKTSFRKYNLESETNVQLEEMYIKFLSKCCLCHPPNQNRLAKVLCEVISLQTGVITGFMRRLVLQLLLENEKIPVNITADETLYKSIKTSHISVPTHPAFKQTYKRALLHLSTTTTLSDILEEHIYFNPHKMENTAVKKEVQVGNVCKELKGLFSEESDLSVAAGVLAKDKRAKDNKNLLITSTPVKKKRYSDYPGGDYVEGRIVKCLAYSDKPLPLSLTLGQLLKLIEGKKMTSDWPCIHLTISQNKDLNDKTGQNSESGGDTDISIKQQSYSSALQVFSAMGGLALLAQHLPTIYPEAIRSASNQKFSTELNSTDSDWIKVEDCEDMYDEETERPGTLKTSGMVSIMPPYSLTAFGLFLRLPGYAEILLKDMKEALCLLRLVLGVTDDDEGGDIFQSPLASSLPTLPFEVLRKLYDATKLNTDDGRLLRRMSISSGVIHLILVCLGIFTHTTPVEDKDNEQATSKEERSQLYWAKGTGYGTGSTQQSWNVEQALMKQKSEEEHVTILLQVLASYINPNGEATDELAGEVLPPAFYDLLINSCLLPVLSSYLRNDSVLDMARHIPLYKAVLLLLRALAVSSQLLNLLLPQKSMGNQRSISSLLKNMKNCVDTYTSKLLNTKSTSKSKLGIKLEDMEQGEGLANLMPDIQDSATLVSKVTSGLIDPDHEIEVVPVDNDTLSSVEDYYINIMRKLQFGSYEMIMELPEGGIKFVISHHFESNAKATSEQSHPARVKRIAQETVTLSSSLPLSYSSTVFVRYDTSRLDVMKVLITGPADTPYANGCFELDVFFPHDYPISPMLINLETTGHHSVRFNPNLYNDGKVCLSVLNTWHGRPEEKWNVQTSSFLQVLVSIQSLILVPEPYFNEPGYERSRGTPAGNQSSREYNATICQATVRWAMLEQLLNPCPCFAEIILAHFYLKRYEIIEQVDGWVKEFENETIEKKVSRTSKRTSFYNLDQFKKVVQQLKEQLMKLKPPSCVKEEDELESTPTNSSPTEKIAIQNNELDNDIEMQKMVNDMCE
ncbi:baculoviral IAP repeat-containing protein 6 [Harmonia axyridis]|uniref:baculoviral IAP repeat-containing protein 6 n=1 Tax=Harmonia axyridis TaxID=115357 RepID=UPI001E27588E|nr:baculoviral IAP repeat-containing protein 6 [Harmonia axyridis]